MDESTLRFSKNNAKQIGVSSLLFRLPLSMPQKLPKLRARTRHHPTMTLPALIKQATGKVFEKAKGLRTEDKG
jgi:hypothetical protein